MSKASFLDSEKIVFDHHILFLAEPLADGEFKSTLDVLRQCSQKGIIVVLPAYFGSMAETNSSDAWLSFIAQASRMDAVIVGVHGRAYQLGSISYWKHAPVDVFALSRKVDGDRLFGIRSDIKNSTLHESAFLVVGAAALLKSQQPGLSPNEIKTKIRERGRKVIWMISDVPFGKGKENFRAWPLLNRKQLQKRQSSLEENGHKILEVFEGNCLDAALLLGLEPMEGGEWSVKALRADKAQKLATGKGIVVAILDHMFDDLDPFCDRCAEMSNAFDLLAVEDIIGYYLDAEQFLHQFFHNVPVIVDPLKQHRLIADDHTRFRQHVHCFLGF